MIIKKQKDGKLQPNWKGPYIIHESYGNGAYRIKTLEGQILKSSYNIQQLKKYFGREI